MHPHTFTWVSFRKNRKKRSSERVLRVRSRSHKLAPTKSLARACKCKLTKSDCSYIRSASIFDIIYLFIHPQTQRKNLSMQADPANKWENQLDTILAPCCLAMS